MSDSLEAIVYSANTLVPKERLAAYRRAGEIPFAEQGYPFSTSFLHGPPAIREETRRRGLPAWTRRDALVDPRFYAAHELGALIVLTALVDPERPELGVMPPDDEQVLDIMHTVGAGKPVFAPEGLPLGDDPKTPPLHQRTRLMNLRIAVPPPELDINSRTSWMVDYLVSHRMISQVAGEITGGPEAMQ